MKILYIANIRLPTEKAHGVQIMKTCEAFAREGADVTLVVPRRYNTIKEDAFEYYGIPEIFSIRYLPTLDLLPFKIPFAFKIQTILFSISVFLFLKTHKKNVVYIRGEVARFLMRVSKKTRFFWENHIKLDDEKEEERIVKHAQGVVVVTDYYRDEIIKKYGISPSCVLSAPDGVDVEKFDIPITQNEARKKLGLPLDSRLVLYTGSSFVWKNTELLFKVGEKLPENYRLVLVGDIAVPENPDAKVIIKGYQNPKTMPYWLKSADMLVLTGDKDSHIAKHYTSPIKLFEYMASGVPILAPNLGSAREVLTEKTAFFYEADSTQDLIKTIQKIDALPDKGKNVAEEARKEVEQYSWQNRAKNIIDIVKNYVE